MAPTPELDYRQVVVITERQADSCQFINQRTCETSRSADKCVDSHRDHAAKSGANAVMLLMTNTASGGIPLFGKNTTMLANYYVCQPKGATATPISPAG